jgi:pSer/pThr/pTyr-binding forkhead associated (FHA) protein
MSPEVVLFLLRLASALLLLGFMAALGWLIYKDIEIITRSSGDSSERLGSLQVVAAESTSAEESRLFPLYPVTSIGRFPTNVVVINDEYASNEHALIVLRGNLWWLEDLGSRNGTLLNGLPLVSATAITAGDVITVGRTQLKIDFLVKDNQ